MSSMSSQSVKRSFAPQAQGAGQARNKGPKKWKSSHHQGKATSSHANTVRPGDVGIWVTCARGQEAKAVKEAAAVLDEHVRKLYGEPMGNRRAVTEPGHEAEDEDKDEDIEAAIRKEVEALNGKGGLVMDSSLFKPFQVNLDCLLFVRTKAPINPVELVRSICLDVKTGTIYKRRCRYLNRLSPVAMSGKSTENGILDVARQALAPFFDLHENWTEKGRKTGAERMGDDQIVTTGSALSHDFPKARQVSTGARPGAQASSKDTTSYTFVIRPTIRNHPTLHRDLVVKQLAGLINQDRHKVDLKTPDKVILVEIYQVSSSGAFVGRVWQLTCDETTCGIAVVDGDWDQLKRYNINELYNEAVKLAE